MAALDPVPPFDDAEVDRILTRAAELDALASGNLPRTNGARGGGLSLEDLEAVAFEAGIDPSHVRAAATDVILHRGSPPPKLSTRRALLGLAEGVDVRRVVAATPDDATWGTMVQELREHAGSPGVVTTLAGVREWHSKAGGKVDRVSLRIEPVPTGATRISIGRNTSAAGTMAVTWGATFALIGAVLLGRLVFLPSASGLANLPAILGMVGGIGTLVTGGTVVAGRRHVKRTEARLEALMDRLELLALKGNGAE